MWRVPFFDLSYDSREREAVLDVLEDRWLSAGGRTQQFEEGMTAYLGGEVACVAVSSGTAALHMSLILAGIGPGDEVILPGLTFVADLNVVMMVGATPVLADCTSLEDWNIDPEDVAAKVTPRTKGVIAVHYAGIPCDMEALRDICDVHDLALIEDAAHAPGAMFKGRKCGTLGDYGCFSFFSNKNLATGEGGMLAVRDRHLAEQARLLRSHGMTSMAVDRYRGQGFSYDVLSPGLNYRIDEMRSALGLIQLEKLEANNARRHELVSHYLDRLETVNAISSLYGQGAKDRTASCHIFPVLLAEPDMREPMMRFLKQEGIQTSIHYPAFNTFTAYGDLFRDYPPHAASIASRVVTLPLYPDMTEARVEMVVDSIKQFFKVRAAA